MLWHRRKQFGLLAKLLQDLARKLDDLEGLKRFEQLLLQEVLRAEDRIREAKAERTEVRSRLRNGRLPKEEAGKLRVRSNRISNKIEAYQQLLYIWRCMGDGVAFLHLDKHAIKHAYYNVHDVLPKQGAGFVSGKQGLAAEIAVVEEAFAMGLPSILSDLTNSIRYGDVCILTGGDPYFVEVKSGNRLGRRGRRQSEEIGKLHAFYQSDVATNLRGVPQIRRVNHEAPEVNHVGEMNRCIEEAQAKGACVVSPETGLYYVAIYDDRVSLDDLFSQMNISRAFAFALNAAKSAQTWSPYVPFTLTIANGDHLYDFVRGHLYLMVIMDIERLCNAVRRPGLEVWWVDDDDYPLKYRDVASSGIGGLSQHFIDRIGFEFVSLQWVADSQRHVLDRFGRIEQP